MRIVAQRVKEASVKVDNKVVGEISKGLVLLVGFKDSDRLEDIPKYVKKIINLRIFNDNAGNMNLSVMDVKGEVLSISQFTLYGDCQKGNRPSFIESMKKESAKEFYKVFNQQLKEHLNVETGIFGADMQVSLINDGPVTIII